MAAHWPGVDPDLESFVLGEIRTSGFKVIKAPPSLNVTRELGALMEYELALAANRFLGNSVSTFSALIILHRRRDGAWAGYYNGGNIPLVRFFPLFSTPWVFTFNSWSMGGIYEQMLKVAVVSGSRYGRLAPHCVFAGDMNAKIVQWMSDRGVRVIHHEPKWKDQLLSLAQIGNVGASHLFMSNASIVGTWQRIDLPLIPWLDQYTYVLFTDTDIVFRRPFHFDELPLPLPKSVGLGPEFVNRFPYNAGVMVAHLPSLRETYPRFLKFIMSNKQGLVFGQFPEAYGPGDQVGGFGGVSCRVWGA